MKEGKRHILIIRMSALGDVAMTIPVVYSMALAHSDVIFSVLTKPFFAHLFIGKPDNLKIIEADLNGKNGNFKELLKLLHTLGKHDFDGVADLHNVLRSWVIDLFFILKGCPVRIVNKQRRKRRAAIKNHQWQQPFIERYADVLRKLGFKTTINFKRFSDKALPPTPFTVKGKSIGIAPFARYATKTYPTTMMENVVKGLSDNGWSVFLFGARGNEATMLDHWQRKYSGVISVAGRYSLEEELALMSHLRLMVAMDSANQHLATLTGTPILTLWGGTTPLCGFSPYGQSANNQLCLNLPCQPCSIAGSRFCKRQDMACMTGISIEMVIRKIENII